MSHLKVGRIDSKNRRSLTSHFFFRWRQGRQACFRVDGVDDVDADSDPDVWALIAVSKSSTKDGSDVPTPFQLA